MKKIPDGYVITINEIREFITKKYGTTIGCSITKDIFTWVSAKSIFLLSSKQGFFINKHVRSIVIIILNF